MEKLSDRWLRFKRRAFMVAFSPGVLTVLYTVIVVKTIELYNQLV